MPVLFCHCAYTNLLSETTRRQLLDELAATGQTVHSVADLCLLASRRDPLLTELAQVDDLIVLACYPRAVRSLLQYAGVTFSETARFYNLREQSAEEVLKSIVPEYTPDSSQSPLPQAFPEKDGEWIPWFPVLDRERCTNCKQCLNFCLFGVYEEGADGQVEVTNPSGCKTYCPACARICPQAAIVFPKVGDSPINGAEITDENALRDIIQVNVESILGADPYAALLERRKRNATRRLKNRDDERARAERQAWVEREDKDNSSK
jgi:Pyruvate/2-oxoacid:ferredoxin oxidoreductase delta subunit